MFKDREIQAYQEGVRRAALQCVSMLRLGDNVERIESRGRANNDLSIWFDALNDEKTLQYLISPLKSGTLEQGMNNAFFLNGLCTFSEIGNYVRDVAIPATKTEKNGDFRGLLVLGSSPREDKAPGLYQIRWNRNAPLVNPSPIVASRLVDEDWIRNAWNGRDEISRKLARDLARQTPQKLLRDIEKQLR
jgi:hypothetical protein